MSVLITTGRVHAASSSWLEERTANMHRVVGPFVNKDYGFRIEVPPDVAEYVTNGGDANHGPVLVLGERRTIVVYPEYTGFTPGDAQPCARHQFSWEPRSTRTEIAGSFGGSKACVVTFTQGDSVWRVAQAHGSDHETGIMYTILLTTTAEWSRHDFLAFQRVEDSFTRVPVGP